MILTTTESIPGKNYEILGLVQGITIYSTVGILREDKVLEARSLATERMVREANALCADAIVSMRYALSALSDGEAEILAYGTAVKFV